VQNKSDKIELVNVKSLIPHPKNMHDHSDEQIARLAKLIEYQGFRNPLIVQKGTNLIVAGHGRLMSAKKLGLKEVPVIYQEFESEAQLYAYIVSDNAIGKDTWAKLDLSKVNTEMLDLGPDFDIDFLGIKDFTIEPIEKYSDGVSGSMVGNFIAPPFSILDSRVKYWIDRRNYWLSLGIKSEVGRVEGLLGDKNGLVGSINNAVSIFDPVLCEIIYTWFSPAGSNVLDCFAGGSVRGVVASKLDRQYIGVELRSEQVEANNKQIDICGDKTPVWHCGNSLNIDKICNGVEVDLLFSCPPYADLEVYSDNPEDLSTMSYLDFKENYFNIIKKSCSLLKDDSFACFVVGEVRGKDGSYYNFIGDTVNAFISAGLKYYNELILVNSAGTLPLRAGKTMRSTRKIGKMHQNVLVFIKGDPKKASAKCGDIKVLEVGNDEL